MAESGNMPATLALKSSQNEKRIFSLQSINIAIFSSTCNMVSAFIHPLVMKVEMACVV